MTALQTSFRKNRTQWITLTIMLLVFLLALSGMETEDWIISLLRSLSVASVTFLVASGFSLIFGLLDVLNLAHGTLFMIGAYVGWSVYVRPDSFIDLLTPLLLLLAGFALMPLWEKLIGSLRLPAVAQRIWPWAGLLLAAFVLSNSLSRYPISMWDPASYEKSPGVFAFQVDQGIFVLPEPAQFEGASPLLVLGGILLGSALLAFSLAGLTYARKHAHAGRSEDSASLPVPVRNIVTFVILIGVALVIFLANTALSNWLFGLGTTVLFFLAVLVAILTGAALGALIESSLVRPLYSRPMYQLMLTLGLSAIGIEVVRTIWGRTEFTMPKAALFNGTGDGCPAESLSALLQNQCSAVLLFGARVRTYNEIFIPIVGIVVLVAVWLLLQRTRLGMIIRAGVQDSEMVEALGINVRQVFTLVFALGIGLASLGGVIAAPSMGLSNLMGDTLLLNVLFALAIGGLTSYPGAAAGSLIVGLLQQFMIKYGQIGINLPFLAEPFKPSPPLVPASAVLLMVIVLLLMPQGLFGRKE